MGRLDTQVKTILLLDGKQPNDVLKELDNKSKQLAADIEKAISAGDKKKVEELYKEYVKVNKETAQIKNNTFSLEKVLKNLSGSSLKDLNRAYKELSAEAKNATDRQSKGYSETLENLKLVESEIKKVKSEMRSSDGKESESGFLGNMFGVAGGMAIVESVKGIWSAISGTFTAAVNSTAKYADEFEFAIAGAKEATTAFWQTLLNDEPLKNVAANMITAAKSAYNYAAEMDRIKDRQQAIDVVNAKEKARLAELDIQWRDTNKTLSERKRLLTEYLTLAEKLHTLEKQNINDELKANQDYIKAKTELSSVQLDWFFEVRAKRPDIEAQADALAELAKQTYTVSRATQYGTVTQTYFTDEAKKAQQQIKTGSAIYEMFARTKQKFDGLEQTRIDSLAESYKKKYESDAVFDEEQRKRKVKQTELDNQQAESEKKNTEQYVKNLDERKKKWHELQTQISSHQIEIDEQIKESAEINQKSLFNIDAAAIKKAFDAQKSFLYDDYNSGIIKSKEDLNLQLTLLDIQQLNAELENRKKYAQDEGTLEESIAAKKLSAREQVDKILHKYDKEQELSLQQQQNNEIEQLQSLNSKKLISETEFQEAKKAIEEHYEELRTKKTLESTEKWLNSISKVMSAFSKLQDARTEKEINNIEKARDYELSLVEGNSEKEAEINTKYDKKAEEARKKNAKKQKEWAIIQANISGALASLAVWTDRTTSLYEKIGFQIGVAAETAIAIATIEAQEYADGNVDVIGASTGRKYNAQYVGRATDTTMANKPSLFLAGEAGPEMIIDARRTRNMQLNYPGLIQAIRNVPQYAGGNVNSFSSTNATSTATDTELKSLMKSLNDKIDQGIMAKVVLSQFEKVRDKRDSVLDKM